MDSIETTVIALGHRINSLSVPTPVSFAPPPLASLIDRVNLAKRAYDPAARR
ncbi:hypothetical protein J3E64_001223 [Sphingobium sp. OAS761]|uniref:hypothetical protein n=1 Tax=Sphingobium sp. OAS761 TaxID=2817901 RepID=UPI0020A09C6F|nr:hypothetical protein [Sphingobium sp. OAS761]MCP1469548.1 hypothetical protein [Sphingobium sp. OAS761]